MFKNLEKVPYQIKNALLNSSDLKKLIFHNTKDTLTRAEPTYDEVEKFIYIKPIIYIYDDSPEFGVSSFISIGFIEGVKIDGSLQMSIKVTVACQRDIWEIDNNRIRPLSAQTIIVDTLDNLKLGPAGSLIFRVIKEVYFNNDLVGFSALFDIDEELEVSGF